VAELGESTYAHHWKDFSRFKCTEHRKKGEKPELPKEEKIHYQSSPWGRWVIVAITKKPGRQPRFYKGVSG